MVLNPFARARAKAEQQQMAELRQRDGDQCRRCRRTMSFDLPHGHDNGPRIERLDGEFLCHVRCHQGMIDHTAEVVERTRRKERGRTVRRVPQAAPRLITLRQPNPSKNHAHVEERQ